VQCPEPRWGDIMVQLVREGVRFSALLERERVDKETEAKIK
jgi:hypothetical protein